MDRVELRWEDAAIWKTPEPGWCCAKCGLPWYGAGGESAARFCCSTDRPCETCGGRKPTRGYCRPCHDRHEREQWLALPRVGEWEFPLVTGDVCQYIFDESSLIDVLLDKLSMTWDDWEAHVADNGPQAAIDAIQSLMLACCERSYPPCIEIREHLSNWLPEDSDFDTSEIDRQINDWLDKNAPEVWMPCGTVPTTESVLRAMGVR